MQATAKIINSIQKMPVFEMMGIKKSFGDIKVLEGVDFSLNAGEVHCLVGENGAGKSTLCKIIAGIYHANEGVMQLDQKSYTPHSVKDAQHKGIGFIHQELMLVQELTVLENIFLGSEIITRPWGQLNWKEMREKAQAVISDLALDISPDHIISSLSTAQQQMVEIAKAILHDYRILIFDEPTASISKKNTETLFKIIHQLKQKNVAMIYISHRLEEFADIADHITILRDGIRTGTMAYKDTDHDEIIKLMVGRKLDADVGTHTPITLQAHPKLRVTQLANKWIQPLSFEVQAGEILGFAGLVGAGRTEILRALYGADYAEGDIHIEGIKQIISSPKDAVKAGIGFLTEDRKYQGLILGQNIRNNITLPILTRFWNGLYLNTNQEKKCTEKLIQTLQIAASSQDQITGTLSGGNQQKVILARWLESGVNILLFDEPTRGIDVGAKAEIYTLMRQFIKRGGSILMVSSDLPELLKMSDRIIVMRLGKKVGELTHAQASEERLLHLMLDA